MGIRDVSPLDRVLSFSCCLRSTRRRECQEKVYQVFILRLVVLAEYLWCLYEGEGFLFFPRDDVGYLYFLIVDVSVV